MVCFCGYDMENMIINHMDFFKCKNCGYLKKKNIISSSLEKKRYDLHICDEGYKEYMYKVYEKIVPYLENGKSLDFGCGKIHYLADILNENGLECKYYDKYYYPVFPKDKYDNIILIEVFEHIENIYALLKDLKLLLNPKGKIIIMTKPIPKNLENWWYLRDETHISFVTINTMKYLGKQFNMQVEVDEKSSFFIFTII